MVDIESDAEELKPVSIDLSKELVSVPGTESKRKSTQELQPRSASAEVDREKDGLKFFKLPSKTKKLKKRDKKSKRKRRFRHLKRLEKKEKEKKRSTENLKKQQEFISTAR